MNQDSSKKRRWVDRNHYERHYCEVCNVWMASDRASIATHQNGKKHHDQVAAAQAKKAKATAAQEKQNALLQSSIRQMEAAASASLQQDYGMFADASGAAPLTQWSGGASFMTPTSILNNPVQLPPPPIPSDPSSIPKQNPKQEMKDWNDRRKTRGHDTKGNDGNANDEVLKCRGRKRRKIKEQDGHYLTPDQLTWLEAVVFGEILEEDMPIQIWLGHPAATLNEMRLSENERHWKDAIVVATRHRSSAETEEDRMVVDVAYLQDSSDTEEQVRPSVPLRQIRILLGNTQDDRIPSNLEEARLLALGSEDVVVPPPVKQEDVAEIEEATGLSGWSTVEVKRTTVRSELKEERELLRKQRKEAATKAEREGKEAEARRMEEAKVSNADDSALGAYDVWGRTQDGYKGIKILDEKTTSVHDFGKKLAVDGMNAGFKWKASFKSGGAKKRQNRRVTSADDD
jgi:U1 zinc finger